jgi:hypothetical protein
MPYHSKTVGLKTDTLQERFYILKAPGNRGQQRLDAK